MDTNQKFNRASEKTFPTYEAAVTYRDAQQMLKYPKVKIFARNNGTFDVVCYEPVIILKTDEPQAAEEKKEAVHGLTAKERRKRDRKQS